MLPALSVGTFVPRDFTGTVFSVHGHAVNIADDDNYRLVSIIDRPSDLSALSVLVPRLPSGAVPGEAVRIADGILSIGAGSPSASPTFEIDSLNTVEAFRGSIPALTGDARAHALCDQLPALRAAVLAHGSPEGLRDLVVHLRPGAEANAPRSPFLRRAFEVVGVLPLRGRRAPGSPIDLSGLVGLGIGFTPSGDDFIMGFLAAGPAVDIPAIRASLRGTTLGGATLLHLALKNSFPSYMCEFVSALRSAASNRYRRGLHGLAAHSGGDQAVSEAVSRVAEHGATSGTDALAGFICALEILCGGQALDDSIG